MIGIMERVPELRCDPQLVTGYETIGDSFSNALPDVTLVGVIGRAIKVAVSSLDGLVCNSPARDLPALLVSVES